MEQSVALPLSVLVDQMAAGRDGEQRDQAFVRDFSRWLHEKAPHLALEPVERLGLRDVVVTFQMKRQVRLVVTGTPPDGLPGEVTLSIDEHDFPRVNVLVAAAARPDPYTVCTMDFTLAGRAVQVRTGPHAGARGALVVAVTVGHVQQGRVRLESGEVVTIDGTALEFAPAP